MTVLDDQLGQLRDRFGNEVEERRLGSGTVMITVPRVPLPPGWSKAVTTIRFLVPPAYPFAALDCFWTDPDLRLADNRIPQNTGANPIPEVPEPGLWFSWHLSQAWNANRDTLSSWMNSVIARLKRAQ